MKNASTMRLDAGLDDLDDIRGFVEEYAKDLNVDAADRYDLLLAVTEMVTNIIVHGYQGESGLVEIEVKQQEDALVICLRDQAPPFDPTQVPEPDISLPLDQRPLGGMGVHLTREFMDRMIYRNNVEAGNELILVKEGIVPD